MTKHDVGAIAAYLLAMQHAGANGKAQDHAERMSILGSLAFRHERRVMNYSDEQDGKKGENILEDIEEIENRISKVVAEAFDDRIYAYFSRDPRSCTVRLAAKETNADISDHLVWRV